MERYHIYVENMFKGWMGSYYKLLSKEQRKNLLLLFEELFGKSITISNKKLIIVDKEDSVDEWLATNTDNCI